MKTNASKPVLKKERYIAGLSLAAIGAVFVWLALATPPSTPGDADIGAALDLAMGYALCVAGVGYAIVYTLYIVLLRRLWPRQRALLVTIIFTIIVLLIGGLLFFSGS